MKTMARLLVFITISCFSSLLRSQEIHQENFILSIHAGPSWYVGDLIGITDYSEHYTDKLRNGVNWNGEFTYLFGKSVIKGGVGLLYQGSRYTNHQSVNSDEININYVTPQMSLFYVREKFILQGALGVGCMFYQDNSTVYGKPRNVQFNRIAFHAAVSGEYRIVKQWGISARLDWLASSAKTYSLSWYLTE